MAVRSPEKTCRAVRVSPVLSATPNHTRPTGFSTEPPPGPAMPVIATASPAAGMPPAPPPPWRRRSPWRRRHECRCRNAEKVLLGVIAVGYKSTVENGRGTGNIRDGRRDHAAGARFGGDNHHPGGCSTFHQNVGKFANNVACHQASPHRTARSTAAASAPATISSAITP